MELAGLRRRPLAPRRYRCCLRHGLKLLTKPLVDMPGKTFTSLLGIIAVRDSCIAISAHAPLYTTLLPIVAILAPIWVIETEVGRIEGEPQGGNLRAVADCRNGLKSNRLPWALRRSSVERHATRCGKHRDQHRYYR